MRRMISLFAVISILSVFSPAVYSAGEEIVIHVAVNGNDAGSGTLEEPLASLCKASALAEKIREEGVNSVCVKIHGGRYFINETADICSGVSYEAYGDGEVIFTGAKNLSKNKFKKVENAEILSLLPAEARTHVLEYDLNADGLDFSETDSFFPYFYADGKEQTQSKYPNGGYLISEAADGSNKFTVQDERVLRWESASDAYIVGSLDAIYFWRTKKVRDISNGEITLDGNIRKNSEWYITNLLEEIDVPGEYFVDRKNSKLYYYPKGEFDTAEITAASSPVINMENVSNAAIKGITFEKSGAGAIYAKNCSDVSIKNCKFLYLQGTEAIYIDGMNCTVSENYAYGCSGSLVHFEGGVLKTLEPGNVIVENNRISYCGRSSFSNVIFSGNSNFGTLTSCGNIIRNNIIQDCMTFSAIGGKGNNYTIENNEIYNNGYLMDDAGAIYYGRSNIQYGDVIKNNYIHDLNKERSYCGIYSDDGFSGITIINNVVKDAQKGIIINYGMNCAVESNMFINTVCGIAGGSMMSRNSGPTIYAETYNALNKTVYKDAFKEAYPEMYKSLSRKPFMAPWNTKITGNIQIGGAAKTISEKPWHILSDDIEDLPEEELNEKGALTYNSGGYVGSQWVSGTRVDDLIGYGAEIKNYQGIDLNATPEGNPAYSYSDDYFVDAKSQNYTLKEPLCADISSAGDIDMEIVGTAGKIPGENGSELNLISPQNDAQSLYEKDIAFIWEVCENASKYRLVISEKSDLSSPVADEIFTETYSDRCIKKSLEPGKTYYWKMYAYGIGKGNEFEIQSDTYSFTTREGNLWNRENLLYAAQIAKNTIDKYNSEAEIYDAELIENLNEEYISTQALLLDDTAIQEDYDRKENALYEILKMLEESKNSFGKITKCTPSAAGSEIYIEGEGFEAGSMVSVMVTNPGYNNLNAENNINLSGIQYASTINADENGRISFVFNTIVRGNDMPGEYNVYLSGENGALHKESFIYGTVEAGEITIKDERGNIIEDIEQYDKIYLSCDIVNRSAGEINPCIITALYDGEKLIGVGKTENFSVLPEQKEHLSWEADIGEKITQTSSVKVIIMDSILTLKPLSEARVIYSKTGGAAK